MASLSGIRALVARTDYLAAESTPTEAAMGLCEYATPGTVPFDAIVRHRFSDFVVHELPLGGGGRVELSDTTTLPAESLVTQSKEQAAAKVAQDVRGGLAADTLTAALEPLVGAE